MKFFGNAKYVGFSSAFGTATLMRLVGLASGVGYGLFFFGKYKTEVPDDMRSF